MSCYLDIEAFCSLQCWAVVIIVAKINTQEFIFESFIKYYLIMRELNEILIDISLV